MADHRSRRSVLAAVAGTIAGGGLVGAASGDASAAVTLGQLSVGDGEESVRGDVTSVTLSCAAGYRWDVPQFQQAPEIWQVRLLVEETVIGTADGRAGGREDSGTASLSGSVLDAGYAASDFQPDGSAVTVDVPVAVELEVLGGRTTVATARQEATVSVTVTEAGYDASLHGSVGGRVAIGVSGQQ